MYINIILEIVIAILNLYSFIKKLNPTSTICGKIKTIFLFILLSIIYLRKLIYFKYIYLIVIMIVTIGLQIITIISYIIQIKKRQIAKNLS
jgi:phosphatidylglycerophosphate synthase